MEKRLGNIIIHSPGGTAAKSSSTYKLSLPSAWMNAMGITEESRQAVLSFDGTAITITKKCGIEEFIRHNREKGHRILLLRYYDGGTLCSTIAADVTAQNLCVEDSTTDPLHTAFGNNKAPSWEDYQAFLEGRCIPRARAGLRDYLETIGLEEYDPLEIIKKTSGRMAEDHQWIALEEVT